MDISIVGGSPAGTTYATFLVFGRVKLAVSFHLNSNGTVHLTLFVVCNRVVFLVHAYISCLSLINYKVLD